MKLVSWNVNGLRAVLKKGALDAVLSLNPDFLCVQETKCQEADLQGWIPEGYHSVYSSAEKKGYSGTAIYSREPLRVVGTGMGVSLHDREGRIIAVDAGDFFLVNVYVPNSQRELTRLDYRQEWDRDFAAYLEGLNCKKPVIVCGDFNVAHTEIDLARPKENTRTHGFTQEERSGFDGFMRRGFLDTFRVCEKGGGHYTWWSVMGGARARNIGWRIDYFLAHETMGSRLRGAAIHPQVTGSDHCPVSLELDA
jgi:exodeoxyribonuclease-3